VVRKEPSVQASGQTLPRTVHASGLLSSDQMPPSPVPDLDPALLWPTPPAAVHEDVPGLLKQLGEVPDPRVPRGVIHALVVVLALTTCAVLLGHRRSFIEHIRLRVKVVAVFECCADWPGSRFLCVLGEGTQS